MLSFLFDLISACSHFMWDAFCALLNLGMKLISAVATVLTWPVKAFNSLLRGTLSWTPFFLFLCVVLGALLLVLTVAALVNRSRRFK